MPRALPLTGAGNSQKTKARDVLPQGSSGQFARLPLETGECLSAAEHNAPVAVHIQWHQGGIAYGTNVPEYLANTWFLCSECAFHTRIGFRESIVGSIPTRSTISLLARAVVTTLFALGRRCFVMATSSQ